MLGRLVLIAFQLAIGWRLMSEIPQLLAYLPPLGDLRIFAVALVFALIVWIVGLLGALVLKDVASPTPATLTFAIVAALAFAALTLIPEVTTAVRRVVQIQPSIYPLIGAVIGYAIKR